MRQLQILTLSNATPADALALFTASSKGKIIAVQFGFYLVMTLGAGDEASYQIELSTAPVMVASPGPSQGGAGVVARSMMSGACDIAGTSIAFNNPANVIIPCDFSVYPGEQLYINAQLVSNRAGGVGLISGLMAVYFEIN